MNTIQANQRVRVIGQSYYRTRHPQFDWERVITQRDWSGVVTKVGDGFVWVKEDRTRKAWKYKWNENSQRYEKHSGNCPHWDLRVEA